MPVLGAQHVECRISVFREGLLTTLGHDVSLRVAELTVRIADDDSVSADLEATSLQVCEDATGPSDAERREIERNAQKTLDTGKFPRIEFRSADVHRSGNGVRIAGKLSLHGVARDLSFDAHHDGECWRAEIELDQRDFGIKPFSAMFGALKIKPEVVVRIAVQHP